jgi:hypothetical protein
MELASPDEQTMVRLAVDQLSARFPSIERGEIETTVARLVSEWCRRARVKPFVGIIAQRQAREELERAHAG